MNNSSTFKELVTCTFHATPNTLKSCTMQDMLSKNAHKVYAWNKDR